MYQTEHGTLRNVAAAIRRGRQMKCAACGARGATLGCRVERCPCSYHLACARGAGRCAFYTATYQVACPQHAPAFAGELRAQAAAEAAAAGGGGGGG